MVEFKSINSSESLRRLSAYIISQTGDPARLNIEIDARLLMMDLIMLATLMNRGLGDIHQALDNAWSQIEFIEKIDDTLN